MAEGPEDESGDEVLDDSFYRESGSQGGGRQNAEDGRQKAECSKTERRMGERRACAIEDVVNKRLVTHLLAKSDASFETFVTVAGSGFKVKHVASRLKCTASRQEFNEQG